MSSLSNADVQKWDFLRIKQILTRCKTLVALKKLLRFLGLLPLQNDSHSEGLLSPSFWPRNYFTVYVEKKTL